MNEELKHYGILGMHWGIRRFQPYPSDYVGKGKYTGKTWTSGPKGKPSNGEKVAQNVSNTHGNVSNIIKTGFKMKNQNYYEEARKMSDDELRKRINRMQMEKQYNSLSRETLTNGEQKVSDMLDIIGDITAITVSAAAIATAIYSIKHSCE